MFDSSTKLHHFTSVWVNSKMFSFSDFYIFGRLGGPPPEPRWTLFLSGSVAQSWSSGRPWLWICTSFRTLKILLTKIPNVHAVYQSNKPKPLLALHEKEVWPVFTEARASPSRKRLRQIGVSCWDPHRFEAHLQLKMNKRDEIELLLVKMHIFPLFLTFPQPEHFVAGHCKQANGFAWGCWSAGLGLGRRADLLPVSYRMWGGSCLAVAARGVQLQRQGKVVRGWRELDRTRGGGDKTAASVVCYTAL